MLKSPEIKENKLYMKDHQNQTFKSNNGKQKAFEKMPSDSYEK